MSGVTTWRSRPVFITSTFLDMQDERDFLRNVVFPELEEQLKARRQHLEWIDLRVGVANATAHTEEERELQVLKVCLAEVKRSRPFLIALIGDRYGTVLPQERINAATVEEDFTPEVTGCSVTHLEIDFGVFSDPEQCRRSYFYFREPLPYAQMGKAAANYSERFDINHHEAAGLASKLEALKRRIKKQFPDRVRTYRARWNGQNVTGFDELRNLVIEDIRRGIEAETAGAPAAGQVTWQQAERAAMADFAEDRARDFVGRAALLGQIAKFAGSKVGEGSWGLCVTAAAGAGKSALWGTIQIRLAHSEHALILAHASGASPQASSVDFMLRRWIDELAAGLGVPSGLADDAKNEDIEAAFASLLGRAAQKHRVLVLIDALDQFEQTTRALHMTWLPRPWPENARLLVTAIAGEASNALLQRTGTEEVPLMPLDLADARGIIVAVCKRYHRTFEAEVIQALVAKKRTTDELACGNPLWLTMAVEELNLLDADDFARVKRDYSHLPAEQALRALMCDMVADETSGMPAEVSGLYAWSFDRAANLFSPLLTQAFLSAIAVSRGGWRESDFRKLLPKLSGKPWDELRFAQLRHSFRGQLRRRGALGQWDFAHGQMRPAAMAWLGRQNARSGEAVCSIIADHLLALSADDPLHVSETMCHLLGSDDWPRAGDYYGSPSLTAAELQGATRVLANLLIMVPYDQQADVARGLARLVERPGGVNGIVAHRFLFDLREAIEHYVPLEVKFAITDLCVTIFEEVVQALPNEDLLQRDLSVSYQNLGLVLVSQGNLADALRYFGKSHAILEQRVNATQSDPGPQGDLSAIYDRIGEVLELQGDLPSALKSLRQGLAIREQLASAEPGNVDWQDALAASYYKIGNVLLAQRDLAGASEALHNSLSVAERRTKSDPDNTKSQTNLAASHIGLARVLEEQGNLTDAQKHYGIALGIEEGLARLDPGDTSLLQNLAMLHKSLAGIQSARGNQSEAIRCLRDSLFIQERLTKFDPENVNWQYNVGGSYAQIGCALWDQNDLVSAYQFLRQSLAIFDRLSKHNPTDVGFRESLSQARVNLGCLLKAQNNAVGALQSFSEALPVMENLVQSGPSDPKWQRHLAGIHVLRAEALLELDDATNALIALQHGRAVIMKCLRNLPAGDPWRNDCVALDGTITLLQSSIAPLTAPPSVSRAVSSRKDRTPRQLLPEGDSPGQQSSVNAPISYRRDPSIAATTASKASARPGQSEPASQASASSFQRSEIIVLLAIIFFLGGGGFLLYLSVSH